MFQANCKTPNCTRYPIIRNSLCEIYSPIPVLFTNKVLTLFNNNLIISTGNNIIVSPNDNLTRWSYDGNNVCTQNEECMYVLDGNLQLIRRIDMPEGAETSFIYDGQNLSSRKSNLLVTCDNRSCFTSFNVNKQMYGSVVDSPIRI